MGQYVSRGGKQYYKGDDGKLYTSFQGANAARIGNTLEGQIAGGVASFLNTASAVPGAMASAFYDPTKRFGRAASADEIPAPGRSTRLITSGDADLGNDPGRMFPVGQRRPPAPPQLPLPGANLGATPVPLGGGRPTPIIQASDETYKTLLSQYGGAPGISQLAGMTSLPTGFTPTGANRAASLKDYYAAQNLQGSANLGTIISDMGYKVDMAKWAQLHPALAQEQYAKKQAAASYGGYGAGQPVADPALQGTTGSFFPGDQSAPIGNPPVNPMMGGPALNSAVSPQTAYNFKFGSENFGTPDNSAITGAANFTPAPPADVHRADFNNRMDAVNYQKARTNLGNTLPDFSAYWNSPR